MGKELADFGTVAGSRITPVSGVKDLVHPVLTVE